MEPVWEQSQKFNCFYSPPLRQNFFFSFCLLLAFNDNPTCPQFSKVSESEENHFLVLCMVVMAT